MPSHPAIPVLTAAPAAESAPTRDGAVVHVLLLSPHRGAAASLLSLLNTVPGRLRVSPSTSLTEAMLAVAAAPPDLAVVDAALCDALEREFVDHLLRASADARVLLLGADAGTRWPLHPRLDHVAPGELLPAVERWVAERADLGRTPP